MTPEATGPESLRRIIAEFVQADDDAAKNPIGGLSLGGLRECVQGLLASDEVVNECAPPPAGAGK